MVSTDPRFVGILSDAGVGPNAIDYITERLRHEDLTVVPINKVYLRVKLPRFLRSRQPTTSLETK